MVKIIKKILLKLILILDKFQKLTKNITPKTYADIQAGRVVKWFEDKGDETHRLNYELN